MSEPQYVRETLAWCNKLRAQRNMEPLDALPKGYRNQPMSCPCGQATGACVQTDYFWLGSERRTNPRAVTQFVRAFDSGRLPQYDAGRVV